MVWSSDHSSMCRMTDPSPSDLMCSYDDLLAGDLTPAYIRPVILSSPVPDLNISHTNYGGAQGIRTLLLQVMSLACCRYTIRPVRRMRWRVGGLEGEGLMVVLMQPRRRDLIGQWSHMYDDMRRIRTTGVATICYERMDLWWDWLLDWLGMLLRARNPTLE